MTCTLMNSIEDMSHSAGEVICDDFYIIYASDEDLSCGDDEK